MLFSLFAPEIVSNIIREIVFYGGGEADEI